MTDRVWIDDEAKPITPEGFAPTVREALAAIVDEVMAGGNDSETAGADAILAAFAVIPKTPVDGQEVDVPGWIVDQITADMRAGLMDSITRASNLAVSVAERETVAYMLGWNEALAAVERGDEVEPMTAESVIEEAEEIAREDDDDGA